MDEKVAALLNMFLMLTPAERAQLVRALGVTVPGTDTYAIGDSMERHIKTLNLGSVTPDFCPYCGKRM